MDKNQHGDTVVTIPSIKKTVLLKPKRPITEVENELTELEQEMNWKEDDKKIVGFLSKSHTLSPELEQRLLEQIALCRQQNSIQYSQWLQLIKLQETGAVTRGLKKSKKAENTIPMQLLQAQTAMNELYLQTYKEDTELKHAQLKALQEQSLVLQESNEQNKKNIELFNKYWIWAKRGSIASVIASVVAIIFSGYSYLSQNGYL